MQPKGRANEEIDETHHQVAGERGEEHAGRSYRNYQGDQKGRPKDGAHGGEASDHVETVPRGPKA
jgi:hypothetical protein